MPIWPVVGPVIVGGFGGLFSDTMVMGFMMVSDPPVASVIVRLML